jgi:pilus assembly protein CpaB
MGERRFGLVLAFALLVASLAGFGVYRFLEQTRADSRVATGQVVVAAVDLPEGKILRAEDVKVTTVPRAGIVPGAYSTTDSVVGRVTRIPVFNGEALVPGRLAPVGSGAGLEVKITPGKRAMAVRIDDVVGLSGLIQPNSRVDVLVTLKADGTGEQQQRAKLFMSNMRVLSVGANIERGPDGRALNEATAALEVTPQEAEQLAIATNQGKIQLVLRGYGDPDTITTRGASMSDISLGRSVSIAPQPAPARREEPARRSAPAPRPAPTPAPVVIAQQAAPPAPKPRNPDSSVVQIYRGNGVTQTRIEKKDTVKP